MKTKNFITTLFISALLSSCMTGSYIITGITRAEIEPEEVILYLDPIPSQYETIGIVEASGNVGFSAQRAMDRTVKRLKKAAAKIGANGIILGNTGTGDGASFRINRVSIPLFTDRKIVQGQAVFVIRE